MLGCHLSRPITKEPGEGSTPFIKYLVPGRDYEQRQERRRDHAADHRDAQRSAELRALAAAERNWNHARDERERRHQDRPQTDRAGFDQRLTKRLPVLLPGPLREIDEQNRVLRDDAHQHHHADQCHDVDRVAGDC